MHQGVLVTEFRSWVYSKHSWAQLTKNVASANRLTLTETQNVAQLIAKR